MAEPGTGGRFDATGELAPCATATPSSLTPSDSTPIEGGGPRPKLPHRYEVIRFLGLGGMGRVYLCRDTELNVEVAVKVLPAQVGADPKAVEQIRREARAAAKFRGCPGILQLYGFEQCRGDWFLVMEFAAQGSLQEVVRRRGRLPESECRRLGAQLADGLAVAHAQGVLHCDIKPANILVAASGDAKIADFGIARIVAEATVKISTADIKGSPPYIAPEVINGLGEDFRTDVYSLGATLYEMAAGEPPFKGRVAEIVLAKVRDGGKPPDLKMVVPELTDEFCALVAQCMAQRPENRPHDASSVAFGLRLAPGMQHVSGPIAPVVAPLPGEPNVDATTDKMPPPAPETKPQPTTIEPAPAAEATPPAPAETPAPEAPAAATKTTTTSTSIGTTGALRTTGGLRPGGPATTGIVAKKKKSRKKLIAKAAAALLALGALGGGAWWWFGMPVAPPATVAKKPVAKAAPKATGKPGLLVCAEPLGATITVDGKDVGPATKDGLFVEGLDPKKKHHVRASLQGHEPVDENDVVVPTDDTRRIAFKLHSAGGVLRLHQGPPGALVVGKRKGRPDITFTLDDKGELVDQAVDLGEFALSITRPGFEPATFAVKVVAGSPADADVPLIEHEGAISATSKPVGAELFDGETAIGATPIADHKTKPGPHKLRLVVPGRPPIERDVVVHGDETADLGEVDVPEGGTVDFSSLPADVTATIDGEPAKGAVVAPVGKRRVVLKRAGWRDQVLDVDVEVGATSRPRPQSWIHIVPPAVAGLAAPNAAELALARTANLPPGLVLDDGRVWCEADGAEMVVVPAGDFAMGGAEADLPSDTRPVRRVAVSAYLLDRHEVTNAQFAKFVAATNYKTDAEREGRGSVLSGGSWSDLVGADWRHPEGPSSSIAGRDRNPVVLVSWNDAAAYAAWAGKRLPTEAEFERALRGGLDAQRFPWGDSPRPPARSGNFCDAAARLVHSTWTTVESYDDKYEKAAPVGSFEPNAFGLFDVAGNVWEWCQDYYDAAAYSSGPKKDPRGPASGAARVVRGGSWFNAGKYLTCAFRNRFSPRHRLDLLGFRCAANVR